MNDETIISFQRSIINGLLLEEFNPDENNKKFKMLEKIVKEKYVLFNDIQISILKKAYNEVLDARKDGCYECWILNEAFIANLTETEKAEILEIQSNYSPLITEVMDYYLKQIHKYILIKKVI